LGDAVQIRNHSIIAHPNDHQALLLQVGLPLLIPHLAFIVTPAVQFDSQPYQGA
jgi:hypothetical protein